MPSLETVKTQAVRLAQSNLAAEPRIQRIFWFPNAEEIRLVEIEDDVPKTEGQIDIFYFGPSPRDGLTVPSGIAIIRPEEIGQLALPAEWGSWQQAELLINRT